MATADQLASRSSLVRGEFVRILTRRFPTSYVYLAELHNRIGLKSVFDDESLPIAYRRDLLGLHAEVLRNRGDYDEALLQFEQVVDWADSDDDRHFAKQGIAACYRSLGRLDEAIAILKNLVEVGGPQRRVMAANALFLTLSIAGRPRDALATMDEVYSDLKAFKQIKPVVGQFLVHYAHLVRNRGENDRARALAREAHAAALACRDSATAQAALLLVDDTQSASHLGDYLSDPQLWADWAVGQARSRLARLQDGPHAEAEPDISQAELFVRNAIARSAPHDPPTLWQLHTLLAAILTNALDSKGAAVETDNACAALGRYLDRVARHSDAAHLLSVAAFERRLLAQQAYFAFENGFRDARWLSAAIDRISAPILSARLLTTEPDAAFSDANLAQLFKETPATIVQVVPGFNDLMFLMTRPRDDGEPERGVVRLGIATDDAARTANALQAHVRYRLGNGATLGLERVPDWSALAQAIQSCMTKYAGWVHLAICPGPLGPLPFALALDGGWSPSFIPSITALLGLRARRRRLACGIQFRPSSLADFAVWHADDAAPVVEALKGTPEDGRRIAAAVKIPYNPVIGIEASAERLTRLLSEEEAVRIACHGRFDAASASFEFVVADGTTLPQAASIQDETPESKRFRVDLTALATLPRTPSFVFASSCCAGAAQTSPGGERIGLERALFDRGTVALCAAMWDVDAAQVRDFLGVLMETWWTHPSAGLDVVRNNLANIGLAQGIVPGVARALAVFGDGLGEPDQHVVIAIGSKPERWMAPGVARNLGHIKA